MRYPAWTNRRGYPLSWAHFVVGLRRMAEEGAREEIRGAAAARLAQAEEKDYKRVTADLKRHAGLA